VPTTAFYSISAEIKGYELMSGDDDAVGGSAQDGDIVPEDHSDDGYGDDWGGD